MTLTAQASITPEFSSPASPQLGDSPTTTGDLPAAGLSYSAAQAGTATESPQPGLLAIITANPLTMVILAFVVLSNIFLLLILLRKSGKQYPKNPIQSKLEKSTQEINLLKMIYSQVEKQQNLLQFMERNQQALLRKMQDMEQSIKRMGRLQVVPAAPPPRVRDNPQPIPRLGPADHLVQVLEQGGDRAALAQWSAVKVKITAASQNRIYRGDIAGIELEPAQAEASFLVFQVNGENLLVPNQETLGVFQRYQTGHTGLFELKRQSRPAPQVSEPARVQPQGRIWRVVEKGKVLIRG